VFSGGEDTGGEADMRSPMQGFGSKRDYGSWGSLRRDQLGRRRMGGGQRWRARAEEASGEVKLALEVIGRRLELEEAITHRAEDGGPIFQHGRRW
jgi:hypothetical protein